MARRSDPQQGGTTVAIYMLGPETWCTDLVRAYGKSAVCGTIAEDFAQSAWPVVVKAKIDLDPTEIARRLRDLADAIDSGFFIDVEDEEAAQENSPLDKPFFTPEMGHAGDPLGLLEDDD